MKERGRESNGERREREREWGNNCTINFPIFFGCKCEKAAEKRRKLSLVWSHSPRKDESPQPASRQALSGIPPGTALLSVCCQGKKNTPPSRKPLAWGEPAGVWGGVVMVVVVGGGSGRSWVGAGARDCVYSSPWPRSL